MRHRVKGRKFGRKIGQRRAFLRQLLGNFIEKERIETTEARAKELRRLAEKFVTISKKGGVGLAAYRLLRSRLPAKAAKKLAEELGPRYKARRGGYTRIIKIEKRRKRDGAKVAILEFVK